MKIKICGLFREQDIDYVNEARPDYAGFVFAESKRQVSPAFAAVLRGRLSAGIIPVGVFVNAPITDIASLYREDVIAVAQLHGTEDAVYISRLKEASAVACGAGGGKPIEIIKTIRSAELIQNITTAAGADYCLIDSGAGSGKPFNWKLLSSLKFSKPWFLAGGISLDNIEPAMALEPFSIDISSGAETDGIKDREKIVQLVTIAHKGQKI
jgi:phosphoribosylanthranilate isomerase